MVTTFDVAQQNVLINVLTSEECIPATKEATSELIHQNEQQNVQNVPTSSKSWKSNFHI
jgi:hypothetical protein